MSWLWYDAMQLRGAGSLTTWNPTIPNWMWMIGYVGPLWSPSAHNNRIASNILLHNYQTSQSTYNMLLCPRGNSDGPSAWKLSLRFIQQRDNLYHLDKQICFLRQFDAGKFIFVLICLPIETRVLLFIHFVLKRNGTCPFVFFKTTNQKLNALVSKLCIITLEVINLEKYPIELFKK